MAIIWSIHLSQKVALIVYMSGMKSTRLVKVTCAQHPCLAQPTALFFSNIACMGHCGCAVVYEGSKAKGFSSTGVMRPGLSAICGHGGGSLVVICSSPPTKGACPGNIYLVHTGTKESRLSAKPLCPDKDDLWQFVVSDDDQIEVNGPGQSHYAILYSHSERFARQQAGKPMGKVYHTQTYDGSQQTRLLGNCSSQVGRSLLLMCSCSSGMLYPTIICIQMIGI